MSSAEVSSAEIVKESRDGRVATLTLNRPEALNALNSHTMRRMAELVAALDADPSVGCIVITGEGKAFAAGADIKEMQEQTATAMASSDFFAGWQAVADCRTPMIAAVNGFALGGGCELAMMCDMIIASELAQFGQPEILLGVMPGMGGSQRLTKAIGKYKAMDLILTGRRIKADEADRIGLTSRVVPAEKLMEETMEAAQAIANFSKPAAIAAKEATNRALELGLREGLLFERRTFHALFANEDQKEGMRAFSEKRKPDFKHR